MIQLTTTKINNTYSIPLVVREFQQLHLNSILPKKMAWRHDQIIIISISIIIISTVKFNLCYVTITSKKIFNVALTWKMKQRTAAIRWSAVTDSIWRVFSFPWFGAHIRYDQGLCCTYLDNNNCYNNITPNYFCIPTFLL